MSTVHPSPLPVNGEPEAKQQAINEVFNQLQQAQIAPADYGDYSIRFWVRNENGGISQVRENVSLFHRRVRSGSFAYNFLDKATAVTIYPRNSKIIPSPVMLGAAQ